MLQVNKKMQLDREMKKKETINKLFITINGNDDIKKVATIENISI